MMNNKIAAMKNTFRFLVATLLLFPVIIISGCKKEYLKEDGQAVKKTFVATLSESSKTSLNDNFSVDWSKDDIIRYYSSNGGIIYEHTVDKDCHSTQITATVSAGASYFIAAYGASSISDNTGKSLTLNGAVKAEQSGTFKDAHLSIAKVYLEEGQNDYSLNFSNITSLIKFSLERTDVDYVIFSTSDETKIQGKGTVKVTYSDTTPSFSFGESGGSSVKVTTSGAGTFYIATLPCSFTGFTIKCFSSTGECLGLVTYIKQLTLGKDKITNLGTLDSRIKDLPATDLSENGTANCYIVSEPGKYKFKTVRGNSTTSAGDIKGVKVLWESFGTDTAPSVGDLIKTDVSYADNYITFSTNDTYKEGNAVIAAYSDTGCSVGNVLWSWHIWLTDKPEEKEYNNNAGTMMDRNLGATSASPGDVHALGLMYQWGRKDPFMGSSSIASSNKAKATISWPNNKTASETSTLSFSIQNPSTYMLQNETNHDWLYSNNNPGDWKRWHNGSKSEYDPCPMGWRVPDGGNGGVYSLAFGGIKSVQDQQSWNEETYNFNFSSYLASSTYYSAAGAICDDGTLDLTGKDGNYWTSDVASLFDFHSSGIITTNIINNAHYGRSVRCMKDVPTPENVSARDVVLNSSSKTFYVFPGSSAPKAQLTATVFPTDASNKTIVWSSTDTSVATVSQSGLVTVICAWGGCDIIATCGNVSAKCEVLVVYWN